MVPSPERSVINVEMLGRLAIREGDAPHRGRSPPPLRSALVVLLALERDLARERLLDLLWPDTDPARARHSLNQALHRLRQDYGSHWLLSDGDRLRATDLLQSDARAFLDRVEAGEWESALSTYGGAFLQGAALLPSRPFEEWVDRWDGRFMAAFRWASRKRIEELNRGAHVEAAVAVARRWVELDPLNHDAHLQLAELLSAAGDPASAEQHLARYRASLEEEGLEPPAALDQLLERIAGSREVRAASPADRGEGAPRSGAPPLATTAAELRRQGQGESRRGSGRGGSWRRAVGWSLGVGAALVLLLMTQRPDEESPEGPPPRDDPVILVAPLENLTGDTTLDALGRVAADWIGQTAARNGLRIVPTLEAQPSTSGDTDLEGDALALAARTPADLLVTGHFLREADDLLFRSQVLDLASGRLWGPVPPVRAPADSPSVALERLEQRVTGLLVAQLGAGPGLEPPTVLQPPTLEAYQASLEGIQHFLEGRYAAAIPYLARGYALDSTFVRAALVSASAHWNMGDRRGADSIVRMLAHRRHELAPYELAHVRAMERRLEGDLLGSLDAALEAADLAPGGPMTGFAALLAMSAGDPARGLSLLARIDAERSWLGETRFYWQLRTSLLHAAGLHDEERTAARSRQVRLWPLHRLLWEGQALAALGEGDELLRVVGRYAGPSVEVGLEVGAVLTRLAQEAAAHGNPRVAEALAGRALAWYETSDAVVMSGDRLPAMAEALFQLGRTEAALEGTRRWLRTDPDHPTAAAQMAVVHGRLGQADSAQSWLSRLSPRPYHPGETALWRARVHAALGQDSLAVASLRRALAEGWEGRLSLHTDPDLGSVLRLPRFSGIVLPAR